MKNMLKRFWQEEEGMGTVEVVIIVGVLVAVALLFKNAIENFAVKLIGEAFDKDISFNIPSSSSSSDS